MAKKDFVPPEQLKRRENGKEFVKQLKIDGTDFGLDADDISQAENAFQLFDENIGKSIGMDAQKQEQNKKTKKSDKFFVALWRELANRMKSSKKYLQDEAAAGERYKIVGNENSIDEDTAKPILKTKRVESGWEISFNLQGFFDAVKIFRKRPNEEKKFLAVDTSSPYIDTEPMAIGTEYTAYYMLGDDTVGLESDKATIII